MSGAALIRSSNNLFEGLAPVALRARCWSWNGGWCFFFSIIGSKTLDFDKLVPSHNISASHNLTSRLYTIRIVNSERIWRHPNKIWRQVPVVHQIVAGGHFSNSRFHSGMFCFLFSLSIISNHFLPKTWRCLIIIEPWLIWKPFIINNILSVVINYINIFIGSILDWCMIFWYHCSFDPTTTHLWPFPDKVEGRFLVIEDTWLRGGEVWILPKFISSYRAFSQSFKLCWGHTHGSDH